MTDDDEVELQVEETVLERLEKLGQGQAHIFDKISVDRRIMAGVAFAALIAAVLFANAYFNQSDTVARLEAVVSQQQEQTNQIIEARKEGRAATCNGFESFANALIVASPAPVTEEARVAMQARIDKFGSDLEQRLGPLGCSFNLVAPGG